MGNPEIVCNLLDLVRDCKPKFIFLLETFAKKIEEIKEKLGHADCFAVDCIGHRGGLGVLWRNKNVA